MKPSLALYDHADDCYPMRRWWTQQARFPIPTAACGDLLGPQVRSPCSPKGADTTWLLARTNSIGDVHATGAAADSAGEWRGGMGHCRPPKPA